MKKGKTPEQSLEDIDTLYKKLEKEKEDRLIDLIVEIIVSSTMKEYYKSIDSEDKTTPNKDE
ncbi:hypothetical protein HX037_03360 [Ignatzschineria indica]|uniref:hypothetical protein n=1 Tax=Ignatzschineria indica TaxID=472583 RepID=UPI002577C0AA|nr:hypothetical protein [Ignatzschineria indica]MDM1544921.1 hypothetical protein [Ignatzschineria indica]